MGGEGTSWVILSKERERETAPGIRGLSSGSILSDTANELSHNLSLEKCPEAYRVS